MPRRAGSARLPREILAQGKLFKCRWISLDLLGPVFNVEILNATELSGIVGHKRKLERTGVRRDEEFVRADHRSTCLERSADLGIVKGCFVRKFWR